MKKKFYNGLLLVAMIFATVGSFVSCKDYNEDMYGELQGQNVTLTERINQEVAILQEQLDALREAQETCKENCNAKFEFIENNYVTKEEYNQHLLEYAEFVAKNAAEHQALEDLIKSIEETLKAADEALEDKLMTDLLRVETLLNTEIQRLEGRLDQLTQTVAENKTYLEQEIANAESRLNQAIADAKTELAQEITNQIAGLQTQVTANSTAIGLLTASVALIEDQIATLQGDVAKARDLAKDNSIRIDALEDALEALKNDHDADVDSICNELNGIKDDVQAAMDLANENLTKANAYTDSLISIVSKEIESTNARIDDIEKAYQAADSLLQEQIDELKEGLEELEKRVAQNEEDIEELFNLFDNVDEALKQFITGILIQGTENPVIGSFALPTNIQSNVLMAYYGTAGSHGAQFPTHYPRYYVRDNETLSQKDIEMLGVTPEMLAESGDVLVSNAGKIYITVNPSNVNFEGQTLPIVNSIEEESGIKLSPLAYSDKKLTFGYTRSAANGLYEADATLAPEDINKVAMTFDFDLSEIKQTLKDVFNNVTTPGNINVTQVANTAFDVLNQFNQKLDANAVKATWTDSLGVTRSVYSQYNLATTAIRPLSYSFMKDVNYTSFPGFDKMRNFAGKLVDKVVNKVKVVLPDASTINLSFSELDKISFEAIEINTEGIDVTLQYDTIINIPGGVVTDEYGNIIGEYDDTNVDLWITMEPDSFKELLKEIEILEDDINNMLNEEEDAINKIIDQINSYLDELGKLQDFADQLANIDTKVDETASDIKNKIINFLNRVENKLLTAVNSANKALQPVLLVKTTDGVQRVSQTIYEPTWMTAGNVQFVPTSYTAEIVAPAYKKLVGVTNVYSMDRRKNAQADGGQYLTALNKANSKAGVAEILEGETLVVDFAAERGYIYEVTYTAVDYSGMVVARKFYVTVK